MAKKPKPESADAVAARLTAPTPRTAPIPDADWLSSGVTTLNLAATGRPDRFVCKGKYVYYVGDSSSGKTRFGFNLLAEAVRNAAFKKHRLVFDNAERGALFDVGAAYGAELARRLEPPAGTRANPTYSDTVQQFFYHIDAVLDAGPCVYLLDSVDAVGADADEDHFEAEREGYEKGKDVKGTYAMSKPKYISQHIGRINRRLNDTGSVLILISQTRDKVGGQIPGQKTRAGGRALKFFARLELWTSVRGPIKKTILDVEREVGSYIAVDVQKNHFTGWEGKTSCVPYYRATGFDDVGACVLYLTDEGVWAKSDKGRIDAAHIDFAGTFDAVVRHVETEQLERSVRALCASRWAEVEAAVAANRKPGYV